MRISDGKEGQMEVALVTIGNKRAGVRELDGRRKGILFWEKTHMRQAFEALICCNGLLLPGFSI